MNDDSFKYILNRNEAVKAINDHFQDTAKLLRDVVDYGTNLIPRCFKQSSRHLEDIVILAVLLKHVVSMLDGIDVLISQGCIYAAHLQVRSLFEGFLSLEWILKDDTEKRAKQYYVWNLRQRRKWSLRFVSSSNEHEDFLRKVEKYSDILSNGMEKHGEVAVQQADAIDELLGKEAYAEINQIFNRLKGDKKFDVHWFTPGGPNSVADMATRVGCGAEYEVFYSQYSQIMHASAQLDNVKFECDTIHFEPIRKLDRIKAILDVGVGFSFKAYRTVLKHYRPEELPNFSRKYLQEWQKAFLTINKIVYRVQHHSLDV